MMVHVDALFGGVKIAFLEGKHRALAACYEAAVGSVRDHIDIGQTAAVQVISAFALICSGCTAPEKVCGESHSLDSFMLFFGRELIFDFFIISDVNGMLWRLSEPTSSLGVTSTTSGVI